MWYQSPQARPPSPVVQHQPSPAPGVSSRKRASMAEKVASPPLDVPGAAVEQQQPSPPKSSAPAVVQVSGVVDCQKFICSFYEGKDPSILHAPMWHQSPQARQPSPVVQPQPSPAPGVTSVAEKVASPPPNVAGAADELQQPSPSKRATPRGKRQLKSPTPARSAAPQDEQQQSEAPPTAMAESSPAPVCYS